MKKIFIITFLASLLLSNYMIGQTSTESLYKEAKGLYAKALEAGASVFAKSDFTKAEDLYNDADEMIKKNDTPENISKALAEAVDLFRKSIETSKLMSSNFTGLMKTRQLVLNYGINQNNEKIWKEAEDNFVNATEEYADKDMEATKKYSDAAEKLYKDAELLAIKDKYTLSTSQALTKAEDEGLNKYAPATLKKAKQHLTDTENILNNNRYDTLKAKASSNLALYELNHGLYMQTTFKKMEEEEKSFEDLQLKWEDPFTKIATEYKLTPMFDSGLENMTSKILQGIKDEQIKLADAKKENQNLNANIADLKKTLEEHKGNLANEKKTNQNLNAKLDSLRKENEALAKAGQDLQAKMAVLEGENVKFKANSDLMEKNTKLIESISSLFLPSEAEVIKNGDLIIVRLVNVNFPQNKATLEPQYFALLNKVQKAIQTFPNGTAVIEGHTDGVGDYQKNLDLSQQRANSVYQYLMSTMGADAAKLSSIGLGGSKPIANNNTDEGRAKNRRIEVVINPHLEESK